MAGYLKVIPLRALGIRWRGSHGGDLSRWLVRQSVDLLPLGGCLEAVVPSFITERNAMSWQASLSKGYTWFPDVVDGIFLLYGSGLFSRTLQAAVWDCRLVWEGLACSVVVLS